MLLSVTWMHGSAGALWLILMRVGQGIGGAMLFANSAAILTDAFPRDQRGLALGINAIAGIAGSFVGLVLGGLLAPLNWRLGNVIGVSSEHDAVAGTQRGQNTVYCSATSTCSSCRQAAVPRLRTRTQQRSSVSSRRA